MMQLKDFRIFFVPRCSIRDYSLFVQIEIHIIVITVQLGSWAKIGRTAQSHSLDRPTGSGAAAEKSDVRVLIVSYMINFQASMAAERHI
jgi:hypothetical protein